MRASYRWTGISDFATVLDDTGIKARRRLFMTATPRYFTGRVLKAPKRQTSRLLPWTMSESSGQCFTAVVQRRDQV